MNAPRSSLGARSQRRILGDPWSPSGMAGRGNGCEPVKRDSALPATVLVRHNPEQLAVGDPLLWLRFLGQSVIVEPTLLGSGARI